MSTVAEIEAAIQNLSRKQLAALRRWFAEYDAASWDQEFEKDVKAGRLDKLAEQALTDLKEGRCTDL
jgi:hypothetical protein